MPETISIPSTPPRFEQTVTPGSFLLFGSILLAAFVFVFWTFIEQQLTFAIEQQADWGHTLVIPFIAGWFVWMSRRQILAEPFRPSVTGLVLVVLGIALFTLVSLATKIQLQDTQRFHSIPNEAGYNNRMDCQGTVPIKASHSQRLVVCISSYIYNLYIHFMISLFLYYF